MAADGGSNQDEKKRRLQLMPEVLPEPKRPNGKGSVRERTVKTKDRLLAISAASAIMAGAASVSGCGYGVVDPLPPPSQCPNTASTITATAKYKFDNGKALIVVELGVPTEMGASYQDADPQYIGSGTLVSRTLNQGALTVTIEPANITLSTSLIIGITCGEGNANINVYLSNDKVTAADGANIPVDVSTGY